MEIDVEECKVKGCEYLGDLTEVGITCIDTKSEDGDFMYEVIEVYLCYLHEDTY